jgi:hypothetical protein
VSAIPREIPETARQLVCTACGSIAHAACDCDAPYVRVEAALADPKNLNRSNVAIARDLGVDEATVRRRRKTGSAPAEPEAKRVGLDGKSYPAKRPKLTVVTNPAYDTDISEDCEDCDSHQQQWEFSAMNLFGEFLARRAYWRRRHSDSRASRSPTPFSSTELQRRQLRLI